MKIQYIRSFFVALLVGMFLSLPSNVQAQSKSQIRLATPLQSTYSQHELIQIEGSILNNSTDNLQIILENKATHEQKVIEATLNNTSFSASLVFDTEGKFSLYFVDINKKRSLKNAQITVTKNKKPLMRTFKTLPSCKLNLITEPNTNVTGTIQSRFASYEIHFQQKTKRVTFILDKVYDFDLPVPELSKLEAGEVRVRIAGFKANSRKKATCYQEKRINATHNHYKEISNEIKLHTIKHILPLNKKVPLFGSSRVPLRKNLAITLPNGEVQEIQLGKTTANIYPANKLFNTSFTPKQEGTYILEINHESGQAVVNIPLYVGNVYPIIPDYQTLLNIYRPVQYEDITTVDAYTKLLDLTNTIRTKQGKSPLELNIQLTQIAQTYSADMVKRDYFSHYSPEGENIKDRAEDKGIFITIGENLAQGISIQHAHEGLLRSPIHRSNLLDPYWEQMGIGVSKHPSGVYYVVEVFAPTSINAVSNRSIQNTITSTLGIQKSRPSINLPLQKWISQVSQKRQSLELANTQALEESIRNAGFNKSYSYQIAIISDSKSLDSLLTQLQDTRNFTNSYVNIAVSKDENDRAYIIMFVFLG